MNLGAVFSMISSIEEYPEPIDIALEPEGYEAGFACGSRGLRAHWGQKPILSPPYRPASHGNLKWDKQLHFLAWHPHHASPNFNASHSGRRRHQRAGDSGIDDDGFVGVGCGAPALASGGD